MPPYILLHVVRIYYFNFLPSGTIVFHLTNTHTISYILHMYTLACDAILVRSFRSFRFCVPVRKGISLIAFVIHIENFSIKLKGTV